MALAAASEVAGRGRGHPATRGRGTGRGRGPGAASRGSSPGGRGTSAAVKKGNRPNTHLNSVGYEEVSESFYQMTGIHATKLQLKNKWDKLKPDLVAWQKLLKQTGLGRNALGEIVMDDEWWKTTKKDIPGSGKFKKRPLQNEEDMKIMFGDITNDESDHWNPLSSNPIIPPSQDDVYDVPENGGGEDEINNDGAVGDEELEKATPSPSIILPKKRAQGGPDKLKKSRVGTALVIQEAVTKISESTTAFTSKKLGEITVAQVMDAVLECGTGYDMNEHYIATELFVKKDQREMFMTIPTNEIKFNWLSRKYNDKYGN
ncbi:hypothetical protein PAHAL_2G083500 [Panicum hallii]|uniref:Myb/SANT-like domain-containing protein n=1 Tax=Panicum hallii TaxID=206008 RepID=A0A2T8KNB4_9POAL|nr:hypothetical protein PAHAL_2G083500 [Panicum hallii]